MYHAMAYSVQGESSSSSSTSDSTPKWKYDVFLSFFGKDSRLNFTDHLYTAFIRNGINAFRDNEALERGEDISDQLLQAIEDSLCAVVVLSENYAYSKWCLDELQKIIECKSKLGRHVYPIFYGVDPSDVRNQRRSFGKALAIHAEKLENKDKVPKWKKALTQVGKLAGWDSRNRHEADLIENIVGTTWTYLCSKLPSYNENLVGINSKIAELMPFLEMELDDVCFVGMWGMGGIGKTTLARVVYEKISCQFEMCCFLENVRELSGKNDLVHLQREILSHLNIDNKVIKDKYGGKTILRKLFCNKKILLVLDDINDASQIENLAESPKWFSTGSRVIITTRDIHLLISSRVQRIYKIETMKKDESLQLFSKRAFNKNCPENDYLVLSESVVKYSRGLPLALHVLGSFLCGRSIDEWKDALERLERIPDNNILERLKISYDALNDDEETIFLHIACFFKGWEKDKVIRILKSFGLRPIIGIKILIQKALVIEKETWKGKCILEMHDLLQDLGKHIIFQESPITSKRSRLWNSIEANEILKDNKGSEAIQAIVLHIDQDKVEVHSEAFSKMTNLKLLCLHGVLKLPNGLKCLSNTLRVVEWMPCPLEALPLEIALDNLVYIQMPESKIKQLWKGIQVMKNLKFINLSFSHDLIETPDFSGVPNLESLILEWCTSLVVVHPSLGDLKKLVEVNLHCCWNLRKLPKKLETNSLIKLDLGGCYEVSALPEFGEFSMKKLSLLDVSDTAIAELPESLGFLNGLKDLRFKACRKLVYCDHFILHKLLKNLRRTPQITGFNLMSLTELDLSNCGIKDGSIPDDFGGLSSLLAYFVNLPAGCFSNLFQLHYLSLNDCNGLESLPDLPPRLVRLDACNCDSISGQPLSDEHLRNLLFLVDHEYRHRTKYMNTEFKNTESEYLPQRDFLAIFPGSEIPPWFPNKDDFPLRDGGEEYVLMVDIPQCCRASEWSGLAVCLKIQTSPNDFDDDVCIGWSSKAPAEEDDYICKEWAHYIIGSFTGIPHLCVMLLHLNEKTCWQHLKSNNRLHVKLTIRSQYQTIKALGCGWRVLCKEEMEDWCNTTNNDLNKITNTAMVATSEVYLPHSILVRTVKKNPKEKPNQSILPRQGLATISSVLPIIKSEAQPRLKQKRKRAGKNSGQQGQETNDSSGMMGQVSISGLRRSNRLRRPSWKVREKEAV